MIRIIGIDSPVSEDQFKTAKYDDLVNDLYDGVMEHYNQKNKRLAEISMPV